MKGSRNVWLLGALALTAAHPVIAQERDIPEEIDDLMHKMSDFISAGRLFSFEVADTIDEVLDNGQKVQYAHKRRAFVNRAENKLRINTSGDIVNRSFWKDGKTITVLDRDHNVYSEIPDPGTIDQTIDYLHERYGVSTPLADLLCSNPYESMMSNVETAQYVGRHNVDVFECYHLAFTQANVDWQIWIDAGEKPIPRKLIITYTDDPSHPQYTMTLQGAITFDAIPIPNAFDFVAPEGAEKIEFLPIESGGTGTAPRDEQ